MAWRQKLVVLEKSIMDPPPAVTFFLKFSSMPSLRVHRYGYGVFTKVVPHHVLINFVEHQKFGTRSPGLLQ